MIQTIRVMEDVPSADSCGTALLHDIRQTLMIDAITSVRTVKVIRLEGVDEAAAMRLCDAVLHERITQRASLNAPLMNGGHPSVEVAYKPGVMNPEAASILKAACDLKIVGLVAADTSTEYHFESSRGLDPKDLDRICGRLLVNTTVQRLVTEAPATLCISGETPPVRTVPIRGLDDVGLMELSKDTLFLNLEEMRVIRDHFNKLGRDPTDAELETLAQTWSEHCKHKTFNAKLQVEGTVREPLITRLKRTVAYGKDLVVSSFVDNSGVIRFYDGWAICGKVETHNSPSAIEPYGGAATGVGGVLRDILGTGLGAENILSTDMFCLAPPDLPMEHLPDGCLHPSYLLRHVVRGVGDYGNRMGIPTANGSFHFDADFKAKPCVIVGAYGIIREDHAQKGVPRTGDAILSIGGRTGRDGIHGATFSSAEMTDRTISVSSSAVQIGHAIEEKRLSDALLACRDAGLIRAVTDCGAGGFSSAIGEMGAETGVRVRLEQAPLKYPGLAPWEIWVSESQERMIVAVEQNNVNRFLEICRSFNVEATVLGAFSDDHRLVVTYNGASVCDLEMEFLHHGLPQRLMVANWQRPNLEEPTIPPLRRNLEEIYCRVLGHLNICSKLPVVRRYDHGVQGTSALPPYAGVKRDAPNDAVVLRPLLDKPYGLVVAHGLNPNLMRIQPYLGGIWAGTEALANLVAVGGNPREAAFIDNFIWPFPEERELAALNMAVYACEDLAEAFGLPFVSGKDSLSGTYRKGFHVVKIPPVLCVSVFGRIPDVAQTVTSDLKRPGESILVFVGMPDADRLGGSVYFDLHGMCGMRPPRIDLKLQPSIFDKVYSWITSGIVLACHDVSEGGLAVALAEMCFGGDCGADLDLAPLGSGRVDFRLFNETAGCFLLEVPNEEDVLLKFRYCRDVPVLLLGRTRRERIITLRDGAETFNGIDLDRLKEAWQSPMKEVFP